MQRPEKPAEPSMEDILASIRKIIAEEPAQPAPERPAAAAEPAPAIHSDPQSHSFDGSPPPGGDLSDILDEPTARDGGIGGLTSWRQPNQDQANDVVQQPTPEAAQSAEPAIEAPSSNPFASSEPALDEGSKDANATTGGALNLTDLLAGSAADPTQDSPDSPLVARLRGLSNGATEQAKPITDEPHAADPFAVTANGALQEKGQLDLAQEAPAPDVTPGDQGEQPNETLPDFSASTQSIADLIDEKEPSAESVLDEELAAQAVVQPETSEVLAEPIPEASPLVEPTPVQTAFDNLAIAAAESDVFARPSAVPMTEEAVEAPAESSVEEETHVEAVQADSDNDDAQVLPVAAPEKIATDNGHESALELALAAMVRPMVSDWLEKNVPALVEKALAERDAAKD